MYCRISSNPAPIDQILEASPVSLGTEFHNALVHARDIILQRNDMASVSAEATARLFRKLGNLDANGKNYRTAVEKIVSEMRLRDMKNWPLVAVRDVAAGILREKRTCRGH